MVEEEIQYLRVAMGHENESFEDFVKAHDACQEDLMFFPTNNSYGLASVAGNADKISALQNEFETVKKRMDDEAKKASRLEQKIKLLTQGYQVNLACTSSAIKIIYIQVICHIAWLLLSSLYLVYWKILIVLCMPYQPRLWSIF